MLTKHKNKLILVFIFIYTLFYYGWISLWNTHEYILTLGGNTLSIIGPMLATIWLTGAYKKSQGIHKPFWLLLAAGTFSFVLAESLWLIYENIMTIDVPYPGSPDIFYVLNLIFYLAAFGYKLKNEKDNLSIAQFIFDIILIMTVYTTFFWYFLVRPILESTTTTSFEVLLSLFYPLGNLILLFFIIVLFFNGHRIFHRYTTFFLLAGVLVQITADIGFLLMENAGTYVSGSLLDPLFILGILLIGFTGLLQKESLSNDKNDVFMKEASSTFRMFFPYVYVVSLFIYMLLNTSSFNEVTFGAGLTIVIIIVRQLLVLLENKRLLKNYKTQTNDLILSQERYKSLFDHHPDAVFSLDLKGHVLSVNKTGENILGLDRKKLISQSIMHFIDEKYKETVMYNFNQTRNGLSQHYEIVITNSYRKSIHLNISHIPIMIKNELVGVFAIAQDITQNKRNEKRIHYLAYHDSLTDLANRTHFEEHLARQIQQSDLKKTVFAVLFMDLNNFKIVNDTYGHAFGDELLTQIGQRIQINLKKSEHGARLGGDEFTLLLTDFNNLDDLQKRLIEIRDQLSQPYLVFEKEIICTPSIGYALYPENGTSVEELLNHADAAMYINKRDSKEKY